MKILFTGGGTGGHILPIIAVLRELKKLHQKNARIGRTPKEKNLDIFYIGPKDNFGDLLFAQEGIKVKNVLAGKIRRYWGIKSFFENIADFFKTPIGIIQSFFYIFFTAPDLIFSKGGYGSIPAVIAGWILRIPIFLHESDAVPGLSNKILAKFASRIFTSFPKTKNFPLSKTILVGDPIRNELLEGDRGEAKEFFKIESEKQVVMIMGGSQGSQRINDKVLEILPEMLKNFEIILQCGEENFQQVRAEANAIINEESKKYFHIFPFLKEADLKKAFAICDIIVSRAGSASIFEISALGKPSILIPLPESAQNHQVENAYSYARTGAAIVLEESNITPYFLLGKIKNLLDDPEEIRIMSDGAKSFSKPQATKEIAKYLLDSSLGK
ncbi:MAG: hypothetical protein COZ91_03230 [Candidatus Nealsonbacteria bacterium CG_4_8_14_3_um_filter_39_7]|uniref:UDP-N-acetylglucosamine--N-acetylmuramyl-(pentapeptide) pyrophosphoryl-undecaprenol N-acetylglucosamine transferase n=1 Tax=Candidatus Nealsonbacteria bacterium CG23_combo_of_CG06-09_8_20_14_all_39_17 TaxID=1974722 RepID=A0A2G9YUE6_9BACT|nr:MAG: hypothetical protein COX37_01530 [Candidatus Nealsonbacteria bacterium CG23_combo_of_CG06-09_8_20_14_all_39_17]PIU44089.1 MAG: hypothetical protein COS96_00785 [Candidatus Nealsonbacteria bacterium CG07_land_8_20_14_0_80_39_13]PIW90910.1 MAG: hypothetical protein COZ91_03230 [Candidatus Nealsonbacteria bacterium CG_4_8_14_3_um_filter_39_7]